MPLRQQNHRPHQRRRTLAQARAECEALLRGETAVAVVGKKPRARPRHIEDDHQAWYFDWVNAQMASDWRFELIYAVPNGGNRNEFEAERMRLQGVRAGVLDIVVAVPTRIVDVAPLPGKAVCGDDPLPTSYEETHEARLGQMFRVAPGLYVELKAPIEKGKTKPVASVDQKIWAALLQRAGYVCCLCFGWCEAQAATTAYLSGDFVPHQFPPGDLAALKEEKARLVEKRAAAKLRKKQTP